MADGKVEIEVLLDDGSVVKGVANMKDQLEGITPATEKANVSVGSLIKAFVGLEAVKKVVSAVGDGIKEGFNFNAEVETMKTGWSTILGGGDKATAMVAKLNDYAKKTPFNTADTDKMGKYLYNAGIEGDKMFKTMTTLGDVTNAYGGSAADAVEVTRQYAQVMQAGTAYTEDLNIMNDRGIPIYQAIAKQMGINVGEVKQMASQGKISSEIYAKAVQSLGDKTAGAMDAQSQTMTGMLSTLEDNFGQAMGTLSKPLFDVAKSGLNGLNTWLDTSGPLFEKIGSVIASGIGAIIPVVVNSFKGLLQVFQILQPYLPALAIGMTAFATAFGLMTVVQTVTQAINAFKVANEAATIAQAALNAVMSMNPITLVALAIGALVTALVLAYQNSETFRTTIMAVWNAISAFMMPIITAVANFLMTTWTSLIAWWDANQESFMQAASRVWNAIVTIIRTVMNIISPFLQNAWDAIKGVISAVWQTIMAIVRGGMNVIQGVIKTVTSLINGDWNGAWNGIKQILQGIWQIMLGVVSGALNAMASVVGNVLGAIAGVFSNIWNGISNTLSNVVNNFGSIVNNALNGVRNAFDSLKNIDLSTIGHNIMVGLYNGIVGMAGDLYNMVSDIAGNIVDTISGALKIHSPSRVMRDKIGKWIPAGIGVGIEKNAGLATAGMDTLATDLSSYRGMTQVTPTAASVMGGTAQPVQPVVHINIEKAQMGSDQDIVQTSEQLGMLTERQLRGRLS